MVADGGILLAVPLLVTGVAAGAFLMNEWSHGGVSEAMGLGHRHMLDYGGYHCAAHDDPELGAMHMAHMHGNAAMPHASCPGSAGMHSGMMAGGMMGSGMMGAGHDA